MKVLFAFNQDLNPYVNVVMNGLAQAGCPVESGTDKFWNAALFDHDIVHIQWPETLFDWRVPTPIELLFLGQRLKDIKRRAKLVYTRHNEVSHHANAANAAILGELYGLLESECDVMIHLAEASRSACLQKPELRDKVHVVIPIPAYDELYAPYAGLDQAQARHRLGIPLNRKIILAFGNFRHDREQTLVANAFLALNNRRVHLLAPKWHKSRDYAFDPRHPMLFLRSLCKAAWGWSHRMDLGAKKSVSDEEVALYFAAADVVFIQRVDDLNSGNIPMAFLFKKVAVGPDSGNIGELLVSTGNPVFKSQDPAAPGRALKQALELSNGDQGVKNYNFAMEHWTSRQIGAAHAALYQTLARSA